MFASPLAAEPSATEGVAMDVAGVVVAADSVLARAMSGAGVGALVDQLLEVDLDRVSFPSKRLPPISSSAASTSPVGRCWRLRPPA